MITLDSLRQQVQQERDIHYEQACEHGEMAGHDVQEARESGRVSAYDEVLAMLAAAELGGHADLPDPVHHHDVFSGIEASTHD